MSEEDVERYFADLFGGDDAQTSQDNGVQSEFDALCRGELPADKTRFEAVKLELPWDNKELVWDVEPGILLSFESQVRAFPVSMSFLHSLAKMGVCSLADLLSVDISSVPRAGESTRLDLLRFMMSRARRSTSVPRWVKAWRLDTERGSALFFLDQAGTLCCSSAFPGSDVLHEEGTGPSLSLRVVDYAVTHLAACGYRVYEPSLRSWLLSLDNLAGSWLEPADALNDILASTDGLQETLELGCRSAIATWYEEQVSLGAESGRSWSFRFPQVPWWEQAATDFARDRPFLVVDDSGREIRFRTLGLTLDEFLATARFPELDVLRPYLDGHTFREVGEAFGFSREHARQLIADALNRVPPLREDNLVPLMEKYSVSWIQFEQMVNIDRRIYYYLKLRRTRGVNRRPIELAVSDEEVPEEIRARIAERIGTAKKCASGSVTEELMGVWRRLRKNRGSIECSARLAFDLYPDLMERIGVKDGLELFELSRDLLPGRFRVARFGPETPIVRIGYCSRTAQIYRLIKQLEPTTEDVLFEEYYRLYRVDKTAFHEYLDEFRDYRAEDGIFHATKVRK